MIHHARALIVFILLGMLPSTLPGQALQEKPSDPFFAKFEPLKAPQPAGLMLREGDRLAICGDSITEQKQYSRAIETYLTACVPQLKITVRQYGWGGETAEGFLRRMTNDCLRFKPTIATTCYGMNDHRYTAYSEANAAWYRSNQLAIVQAFKAAGARVVLGSAGCVGNKVPWSKSGSEDMNLNLCRLRNHNIEIAAAEGVGFADVFWPMFTAGWEAGRRHGPGYNIAGADSVHPNWSGSFIMAYAFLKGLGLDGHIGTFTVDLASGTATTSDGHRMNRFEGNQLQVTSSRIPFCAPAADVAKDDNIRSAWSLVPFNQELNRLELVVKNASSKARAFRVVWGSTTNRFTSEQLEKGINLAAEFVKTPFDEVFKRVDEAVIRKQSYETRQIKTLFHGEEGAADMEATAALTEKARAPLVRAVARALGPVTHTVRLEPEL